MKAIKKRAICLLALICAGCGLLLAGCGGTEKKPTENNPAPHRDAEGVCEKKGVCVSRYGAGTVQNGKKINDLEASWWYNWGFRPDNEYIDAEFVPMIWGKDQANDDDALAYVKENYEKGTFTHLLTFNEPDLSVQANMTVDEALGYWPKLEETGIPLSSPAVSYYSADEGNRWLDGFMRGVKEKEYRVDFIALHIYQSFYSPEAVKQLKTTLDALYAKYKLPIWLTEFGAIDIIARDSHAVKVDKNCTEANARKYIEEVTNMLEQCGYVERYAWFLDNFNEKGGTRPWEAPFTSLYNDDDTISGSGETYRDISSNIPLILENVALDKADVGQPYSQTISVCGGTGDYTFSSNGLPLGLSLSKAGVISGAAQTNGIYSVTITITDEGKSGRRQTLTQKYGLTVHA